METDVLGILGSGLSSAMTIPLLAFLGGLVANVLKVCFTEDVNVKDYIKEHKIRTTFSMSSLVTTFIGIYTVYPEASWLMFAFAGYCVDSIANKAPLTAKKVSNTIVK